VRILKQTSKIRHPYDRSLQVRPFHRSCPRQLQGRRRFAARERQNTTVRFFEASFSRSFITIIVSPHQYYVLAICANGGKFRKFCSATSWLHKNTAPTYWF
jgi:hypothetical protein